MESLCHDLEAEYRALDALLETLSAAQWQLPTGFKDWSVYDQVCHLCISDEIACSAASDPQAFRQMVAEKMAEMAPVPDWKTELIPNYGRYSGAELLQRWQGVRGDLLRQLAVLPVSARLPWYGPEMGARSFVSARLMETWAHGQGIYDALGLDRAATPHLRHICHMGYGTLGWSFLVHGLPTPEADVRLELAGADGETWCWGDPAAQNRIAGPAREFCWVVVQCRHVADTSLICQGDVARQWMQNAQCFAGLPAIGPAPASRPVRNDPVLSP